MKFKVGDKVRITKKRYEQALQESRDFSAYVKLYYGRTMTISSIQGDESVHLKDCKNSVGHSLMWSEGSLELVPQILDERLFEL